MRINFVTELERDKWILRRWCEEWAKHIPNSTIESAVDVRADVNIFCNYALYFPAITKRISIFTHREEKDTNLQLAFDIAADGSDWCFAQSLNTAKYLPKEKTSILRPSVGEHFFIDDPIKIGIVGRPYPSGRKNFDWLHRLNHIDGIEILVATNVPYEDMDLFYKGLDYLLITANNEGGPMPVAEALACHVPVIAPTGVGWCDEFSCIRYEKDNLSDLLRVLYGLIVPKDGWETGARQIMQVCERLVYGNSASVDQGSWERVYDPRY